MNCRAEWPPFLAVLIGGIWIILCAGSLFGAEGNWSLRVWQSDEGLPDNIVEGVAQSPDGFIWVATRSGLARFDGVRFQEFASVNLAGAATSEIQKILLDRIGRLWVAKDRGVVVCICASNMITFTAKDGLPSLQVRAMEEDGAGAVWISYWHGPVVAIQDGRVRTMKVTAGSELGEGYSLASDNRGHMWIAQPSLEVFRDGKSLPLLKFDTGPVKLAKAHSGGIWICVKSRLFRYIEESKLEERGKLPLVEGSFSNPTVLYEDHSGVLWIGTTASGLFRYDGLSFTQIKTSHLEILCLMEDREENLWVGTRGGGLNRVRTSPLKLVSFDNRLSQSMPGVRSVCEDVTGNLWVVGNNNEVLKNESNHWTAVSTNAGWPQVRCSCVTAASPGGVWVGTLENRLFLWDGHIVADYAQTNGLLGKTIRALFSTSSGDVWIGGRSPNSLQRLRDGNLRTFELPHDSGPISAMAGDADGNFWAGTSAGSLLRVKNGVLTDETSQTLTEPEAIRCLGVTPDGSLWIGYAGQGVGRLKSGHFDIFGLQQGLWADNIMQLTSDDHNRMWFAGTGRIFYVERNSFDDLVEGRVSRLRSVVSGEGLGLPIVQASQGYWPGATKSTDGRLWIPTLQGLLSINTRHINNDTTKPPAVVIERVMVDGKTLAVYDLGELQLKPGFSLPVELRQSGARLRLLAGHRSVQFDFAALDFSSPENVLFKYRLQGIDEDWLDISAQRTVHYAHIPPGDYRFQVIACNEDGIWNQTGASLAITSEPHLWETVWFRVAALVSAMGVSTGFVLLAMRRRHRLELKRLEGERAIEQERTRIAQDLHDDLGTTLTQIDLLGALAARPGIPASKALDHVLLMQTKSREMVAALDEIVWAVSPNNDSLLALINYLSDFAQDFLSKAHISCRLDFADDLPDLVLQADQRHNLFLSLKEALNNVVRHSGAGEVWLQVRREYQCVILVVQDNGAGFDPATGVAGAGNGLRNMNERMEHLGGKCEVCSQPGAGTSVKLTLRCPRLDR